MPRTTDIKHLVIIMGAPGAGKSTILNKFGNQLLKYDMNDYIYIDPDEVRFYSDDYRKHINGTYVYQMQRDPLPILINDKIHNIPLAQMHRTSWFYELPTGQYKKYVSFKEDGYSILYGNNEYFVSNMYTMDYCKGITFELCWGANGIFKQCIQNKKNIICSLPCSDVHHCYNNIIDIALKNNYIITIVSIYTSLHTSINRAQNRMYSDGRFMNSEFIKINYDSIWENTIRQLKNIVNKNINMEYIGNNNDYHPFIMQNIHVNRKINYEQLYYDNFNFKFFVKPFIDNNKEKLLRLKKFVGLTKGSSINEYIDRMIITVENMSLFLNDPFIKSKKTTIVGKNQLCVNAEAIKNIATISDSDINNPEKNLLEFKYGTTNNIRKGAMSVTTCHSINDTYNYGCNYNVSLASTFLGASDTLMGRLLLFHTKCNLKSIVFSLDTANDRFILEKIYTRLILGTDYQLDDNGHNPNNLSFYTNKLGFTGCVDCIPQKILYFFLDKYSNDRLEYFKKLFNDNNILGEFYDYYSLQINNNNYPAHDAIFIPDEPTTKDIILNFAIKGTELRIYNADNFLSMEGILYKNKIYKSLTEWKTVVINNMHQYKNMIFSYLDAFQTYYQTNNYNDSINILRQNSYITNAEQIMNYFNTYIKNKIPNKNIFDKSTDIKNFLLNNPIDMEDFLTTIAPKIFTSKQFAQICNLLTDYCKHDRGIVYALTNESMQIQAGGKHIDNLFYYKYLKYKHKYLNYR